jgi:WD40 repeat protein
MLQVGTHGDIQKQVAVWKYPGLAQLANHTGHSSGVLCMAVSPDGEAIITGASYETLGLWNAFSEAHSQN